MSTILKYAEHSGRLTNVAPVVRFTTGAISRHERGLPNDENYVRAKEEIVESYCRVLASFVNPPELDSEELKELVDRATIVAEPSRNLIYNLCFVMLVTQIEIFIEHLIDVILEAEPRRLKDLAGERNLTVAELVDLQAYDAVMKRLREKVSKDVINSSAHDMFVKH